ncbi:MAG TPA: VOC family protein [Polyangia bacterium]|jgi:catechol 2,3-dioxygenase-like lactoylglutathione lyase family enzyme
MATTFDRVAPVLPVRNVRAALEHYRRLGFDAKAYAENAGDDAVYGFVQRDGIELHLTHTPALRVDANTSAVYVYVGDADALYAEWQAAGAGGRFHGAPADTPYRLREFAYVDPDGNLLRIGSEMKG